MILPEGFTSRPASLDDAHAVVGLVNACAIQRTSQVEVEAASLGSEWQSPGFCLETDTRLVHAPDGRLVGCAMLWDREPHVLLRARAEVHPDARGCGLGAALCHWLEERGRQVLPEALPGARVALNQRILNTDTAAQDLLRRQGYTLACTEFRMLIDLDDLPPRPQLPPGIRLRPFVPGQELGVLLSVMRRAFRDHWDYVERPWRRRGVGMALLPHTFRALASRGKRRVTLLVDAGADPDAGNPGGATRMYEKAGMHVQRQSLFFEKELRAGGAVQ